MKWRILISLLSFLLFFASAFAIETHFHVISKKELPNQLGVFQQTEIDTGEDKQTIILYSTLFNKNYQASLFQNENKIQLFSSYLNDLSRYHDFIVAINGGYYQQNYTPVGLFIYRGKIINRVSHDWFLDGCLFTTNKNKIVLTDNFSTCETANNAMQVGPILIQDGKKSSHLVVLQEHSKSMVTSHKRTVLAETDDHRLLIIIAMPMTLQDLTDFLLHHAAVLGVKKFVTAISLDGGSSTGMYIRFPDGAFYSHELRHVKTFVFIK